MSRLARFLSVLSSVAVGGLLGVLAGLLLGLLVGAGLAFAFGIL